MIPSVVSDTFIDQLNRFMEQYGEQPITIMVCKPTLHRLWRIQAQEQRKARDHKRARRQKRATARRKQRGLA